MGSNDRPPRGVLLGLTQEAQRPPRSVKRHDHEAVVMINARNLGPRDRDVHRAVELQPAARKQKMANLVGLAPSEANGRGEVTLFFGTVLAQCLDRRRKGS